MENSFSSFYDLAEKIAQHGGRLYIVGGAVRDLMLGNTFNDVDLCVTGLSLEELEKITHVSRVQGSSFPVIIINGCEVALARTERKSGKGHKGFEINTDNNITIEQDLLRRDVTINSMAIDVLSNKLIDPYGGIEDLNNQTLRHTSSAFVEDPLRVYRVARFASKLGYSVAKETIELMGRMKDELVSVTAERVMTELRKALTTDYPERFFEVLNEAGVLDVHYKEIADLVGVEQPIEYHPEGDAFTHTMQVLKKVAKFTPNATIGSDEELTRFCALVHDLGKGLTPRDEWPHHYGHEERGIEAVIKLCNRIKAPNVFKKAGKLTSKLHMKAGKFKSLRPGSKVKLISEIDASRSLSFKGMEIIARVDSNDNSIEFANLAEKLMSIGATEEMVDKCTKDGVLDYEKLKDMIMQKRVEFLKVMQKKDVIDR